MTSYMVRVELHDADGDDYADLHAAMEKQGFVRWIAGGDGSKDQLPTAEYNMPDVDINRAEVLERAKRAAKSVKPTSLALPHGAGLMIGCRSPAVRIAVS